MGKNKFLTAVCMLSAFVGSNLHAKTSKTKKIDKAKTSHKPVNNRKSHSAGNTGIYGIPSNNKSALIETKMTELRQRHAKVMSSIDCSALTRRVYREAFNKELPRVSQQQIKKGTRVSAKNLKSGDIVYFRPDNRVSHTAVYVGNSLFINASSSKGVVMSSLKSPYWRKYFKYGVRVHNA